MPNYRVLNFKAKDVVSDLFSVSNAKLQMYSHLSIYKDHVRAPLANLQGGLRSVFGFPGFLSLASLYYSFSHPNYRQ